VNGFTTKDTKVTKKAQRTLWGNGVQPGTATVPPSCCSNQFLRDLRDLGGEEVKDFVAAAGLNSFTTKDTKVTKGALFGGTAFNRG
jgi:hypothetical protein